MLSLTWVRDSLEGLVAASLLALRYKKVFEG